MWNLAIATASLEERFSNCVSLFDAQPKLNRQTETNAKALLNLGFIFFSLSFPDVSFASAKRINAQVNGSTIGKSAHQFNTWKPLWPPAFLTTAATGWSLSRRLRYGEFQFI